MRLNDIQKNFKDNMLQSVDGLEELDPSLRRLFVDNHISVEDRLKIYHNNVVGSVSSALCATFPVIEKLVGEDFLKSMARAFVFERAPHSACLHAYGEGFDAFIKSYEPAASLPYLADVATYEYAINTAYYAYDDEALSGDIFTNIADTDLETLTLSLRGSATLIESPYPLIEIKVFSMNENAHDAPDLSQNYETRLMVYRPALEVKIMPLEADEFFMLQRLHSGVALGEAVEKTLDLHPEFDFTAFLKKHIISETFSNHCTK